MNKMNLPKLLVTGISGFLGHCLANLNPQAWSIIGVYNKNKVEHPNIQTVRADLTKLSEVEQLFDEIKPDAVLHLAACSNPNYCESNPEVSYIANVQVSMTIASICKKKSKPLLFSSTDLVFDGTQAPYSESAKAMPISVYGLHKLKTEQELLKLNPSICIARLPVMFGLPKWGNSFMNAWIKNLKAKKKIYAFTDEFRTKVSGTTAVEGMLLLLNKKVNGIWHLGGQESISRYDFAVLMAQVFDLPPALIVASKQADVQMAAARPSNVSLDSTKAYKLGYNPRPLEQELKILKQGT